MRTRKKMRGLCLLLAVAAILSGCSPDSPGLPSDKSSEPLELTGFAFDTIYTLRVYQGGSQELLDSCVSECSKYEEIFSRTQENSQLYQINQMEELYAQAWQEETGKEFGTKKISPSDITRCEQALQDKINQQGLDDREWEITETGELRVVVSQEMAELVQKGLEYSQLAEGGFDITIYPVSSLWDFTSQQPEVPDSSQIEKAVESIDYTKVTVDGEYLVFAMPGMGLDLGGIAKGYIADKLKEYLMEGGVTSGTISLGGNVVCIGRKSEEEPFHIGIQQPFADRNETIAAINADDVSVVSSGVYERYFQEDGKLYHHILNPKTGYSYDNELIGVTIVSEKSVDGDGLSTSAFALGLDQGMKLINSLNGVEALFITEDEAMHYSEGFEEMLYEPKE